MAQKTTNDNNNQEVYGCTDVIINHIVINVPYVTVKQFSIITGMSQRTIHRRISEGELLIRKTDGDKGLVLINMEAWRDKAREQIFEVTLKNQTR